MTNRWRDAWADHRLLLIIGVVYIAVVLTEALFCGVPPHDLLRIFGYLFMATVIALGVLTLIYLGAFIRFFRHAEGGLLTRWLQATRRLDLAARAYMEDRRWSYACLGFLSMIATNFFFIAKSLVPVVNPYDKMKWDFTFMSWDKFMNFGRYPHEILIPFINSINGAHVLDMTYAFWLIVMMGFNGYNLFADRKAHRRLRFLYVYVTSWFILGSLGATALSSTGPLFFHDFFPDAANPYDAVNANLDALGAQGFYFATETREFLLQWTKNDRIFDPNAIAAMPSMHVAIAWLLVLYTGQINRIACALAAVFCLTVFLATVYFGIHYAVDSYVSIPVITAMWFAAGKYLDKKHSPSDIIGGEV